MFGNNRALISKLGISVFLSADLDLLWERVRSKDTRPLLKTADPKATLTRIFEGRKDQYALADVTVQSHPNYSIAQTTEQVIAALRAQPGVFSPSGEKS
jgi:shikimate kinase